MQMPVVQQKWALGDHVLPLERQVLDLVDPSQHPPECREQDLGFLLLSLKTIDKALWLTEYLGVRSSWWRQLGLRQPLMQEMARGFPKRVKGLLSAQMVIPIIVRGKEILVVNRRSPVTMAFVESKSDFESLTWFLGELKKDLCASEPVPRAPRSSEIADDDEQDEIEQVLEDLKRHPNCSKAWFLPSRQALEVHSNSKLSTRIKVKPLKKRGRGVTLEEAASQALAFLQGKEAQAASTSSALEPRDMPVDGTPQEREDLEVEQEDLESDQQECGGPR